MNEHFTLRLCRSVSDVGPYSMPENSITGASALSGDPLAFKAVYRFSGDGKQTVLPVALRIEGDISPDAFKVYKVGNVPVINPVANNTDPSLYTATTPSLCPDPLYLRTPGTEIEFDTYRSRYYEEGQRVTLNATQAPQTLWIELDTARTGAGEYRADVVFVDLTDGSEAARESITLKVVSPVCDAEIPTCTNWFYCDTIADLYGVETFSPRHFELIENYVRVAAEHGMDMILVPAFTPPLDTRIGKERRTVQLVKVKAEGGKYSFDFSDFDKFVRICQKCGIEFFEHSHLFTQWGAAHAPKIVAEVDGEEKRIFGWETDAGSEIYAGFLTQYLTALRAELEKLGIRDKTYFHVSDEPKEEHLEAYRRGRDLIKSVLPEARTFDAMSSYDYYESGSVDIPVVREISPDIDRFAEACPEFWLYYTGGKIYEGNSNRLITLPTSRNRQLGLHMYICGATGFLHWGYNYYYDVLSHGVCDPLADPCFYLGSPGSPYLVYPSPDGKAIPSQRLKVMREAFSDYRALRTLEKKLGREGVMKLIETELGHVDARTAVSADKLIPFIEKVIDMLA